MPRKGPRFYDPTRGAVGYGSHGPVPEKTRCKGPCNKVKRMDQFSNKQKETLSQKLRGGANDGHLKEGIIYCKLCTSQQAVELTCVHCDESKPLDGFAKTHRRNRDEAKCKECMSKIIKLQPNEALKEDDDDDDDDIGNESSDSNPFGDDDEDDVTTSVNEMSLDGTQKLATPSLQSSEGGVWINQCRSFGPSSNASAPTFNVNAYGGARRAGTNTSSNAGFNSSRSNARFSQVKTGRSGWAKAPTSSKAASALDDLPSSDDDDNSGKREDTDSDDDGP